jgi:hypothetical protein
MYYAIFVPVGITFNSQSLAELAGKKHYGALEIQLPAAS